MIDQTISFMWHRTKELYTENLQLKKDAASIAADERAKIVAWLRDQDGYGFDDMRANLIEAGEHLI